MSDSYEFATHTLAVIGRRRPGTTVAQARPLEHGKGRAAFGLRIALDKTAGPEGSYLAALGLSRRRSSRLAARA